MSLTSSTLKQLTGKVNVHNHNQFQGHLTFRRSYNIRCSTFLPHSPDNHKLDVRTSDPCLPSLFLPTPRDLATMLGLDQSVVKQNTYGISRTTITRFLSPTVIVKGFSSCNGCDSPSTLIDNFDAATGVGLVTTRGTRLVATIRHVVGVQRIRMPGVSVSKDSFGATTSALKTLSPHLTLDAS